MMNNISGKNGGRFYVKTYGASYWFNGETKKCKSQKWMVYVGNKHLRTYTSKKDAERACKVLNDDLDKSLKEFRTKQEKERATLADKCTIDGLEARYAEVKEVFDKLGEVLVGMKKHIEVIKERYS